LTQIVTAGISFPGLGTPEVPLQVQADLLRGQAAGPASSIRPRERPSLPASATEPEVASAPTVAAPVAMALLPALRPAPRPRLAPPASAAALPDTASVQTFAAPAVLALVSVPRPEPRLRRSNPAAEQPEQIERAAVVRILPGKSAVKSKKGSVCGDPAIKGEALSPILSRVKGCSVDQPVRVTSVDGVTLSQSAVINCDTARALKQWIRTGLKPAFGRKEVVSLRVAASYACRPRNNVKGARTSEHGAGNAIDISMITLAGGKSVSVAEDWRRPAGKPMKKAYRAACGTFGTTLGPDGDRYHKDHMHFDIARQRGGPYCR
jgi:hypothetical protein